MARVAIFPGAVRCRNLPCAGAWLHLDEALVEMFCSIFVRKRYRPENLDFRAFRAFKAF